MAGRKVKSPAREGTVSVETIREAVRRNPPARAKGVSPPPLKDTSYPFASPPLLADIGTVSVVIPTKNERHNIARLLDWGIKQASTMHSPKFTYEAIVVDDSDDDTARIAEEHGARVVEGKRMGLGQAIIDGIREARGEIVVVMDADLSHNPHAIPGLLRPIISGEADMVIGSRYCRYVDGIGRGTVKGWTRKRLLISKVACLFARPVTKCRDATSGFFAVRKDVVDVTKLKPSSWKIMLEILVKCNPRWVELPIEFTDRTQGASKFNQKETVRYLKHLWKLWWYKRGVVR